VTVFAPFPYFGGKRKIVSLVWPRLGADVPSYLEPFFGSGAMLFGRPGGAGKYETVNDIDGMVSNFFRAVRAQPDEVAYHADYPINETDLHARHRALVEAIPRVTMALEDPDYYDAKVAGWWCWGKSQWIGDGWCRHPEWKARPDLAEQLPNISGNRGVHRKLPELHGNKGFHGNRAGGNPLVYEWMRALAERLRFVRVCAGDWQRILSPSTLGTTRTGLEQGIAPSAVYLDPPYRGFAELYASSDAGNVHDEVTAFCKKYGESPRVRIALSGYENDYDLEGWEVVAWKAHGGYGNQSDENENAKKERIWLSPHCLKPSAQESLWDEA